MRMWFPTGLDVLIACNWYGKPAYFLVEVDRRVENSNADEAEGNMLKRTGMLKLHSSVLQHGQSDVLLIRRVTVVGSAL